MQTCATCGNQADDLFSVTRDEMTKYFDSFECAIQLMAERCPHCQCAILGHGVRRNGAVFCCEHCAAPTE